MMRLRDYQLKAVEAARRIIASGTKSVLINSPTGSGKTVMAAAIVQSAVQKGRRVLFLAHRRELIQQCSEKLTEAGVTDHGVIMAGSGPKKHLAQVQVASIQTLIRREWPPAHLIIIDECHRAIAGQYQTILAHYPDAIVIGLSATPERLDGKGLNDLFSHMVTVDTVPGLIERGYLVKPICYAGTESDLSQVRMSRGDYREGDLQDAMDRPRLIGDIVKNWTRLANGKLTVAFATGVEHARHIAQEFWSAGIPAASIDGIMRNSERDAIIADWKAGIIKVVANCEVLCEGFDFPALECAILARPTKSVSLYLQMVGRVMRSHPGKTAAYVLDHAGCIAAHGAPHIAREWSMEGEQRRSGRALAHHACHAEPPERQTDFDCLDGDLERIDDALIPIGVRVKNDFKHLIDQARSRGWKRGYVWHRLREQYDESTLRQHIPRHRGEWWRATA
ncbi:DNA repair protein RadD [Gammaproteobacteria bacterium]